MLQFNIKSNITGLVLLNVNLHYVTYGPGKKTNNILISS